MTTTPESISAFFGRWVYDDGGSPANEEADRILDIVGTAASALLRSHADTGTDLTTWPGVLELVTLVYPNIVIEGTGDVTANTVESTRGETGRYWITGDTSQPCNSDAYAIHPGRYNPEPLPTTRIQEP